MLIKLVWIGKTRDERLRALANEYAGRLRQFVNCVIVEVRDAVRTKQFDAESRRVAEAAEICRRLPARSRWVSLDEKGRALSSKQLADWISGEEQRGTREIAFIIGGPDGLAAEVLDRSQLKLSLGPMTWTHELCRVLLAEQLYRAYCILRNHPYHRG
jgi:23S rRNA (pseudouridine1915-N3)-methyltransferase